MNVFGASSCYIIGTEHSKQSVQLTPRFLAEMSSSLSPTPRCLSFLDRKFSLRGRSSGGAGVYPSRGRAGALEGSRAAAWWNEIGDSGRAVNHDERVAVALAQSHENLAAAAIKFEESQERSDRLLGGLRGWMDGFTGTARPEDTNPIAAMLPDPGLENEVVAIMTDCQVNHHV